MEQVYDRYYDTVGEYHWTGVYSGNHIERGGRMSRYIDAYGLKDIEYINKGDFSTTRGIREWVDNAPTADVRENKHGEWIFIPIDDSMGRRTGDMVCVCKKCTYEIVLPFSKAPYNYCPYCGADMMKGETNG